MSIFKFLFISIFLPLFIFSCTDVVTFQVIQPAKYTLKDINSITIGSIKGISGTIKTIKSGKIQKNKLSPSVSKFDSQIKKADEVADLVRAMVVSNLSIHSPYNILNTTGDPDSFTGIIPSPKKVAVLNAEVKYSEYQFNGGEKINYLLLIKNNNVSLQQKLLVAGGSALAKASGAGFNVITPYVEIIGALEIKFSLNKKSDSKKLIPDQVVQGFYVRKWGGNPDTSHITTKLLEWIKSRNVYSEKSAADKILSGIDKESLRFNDPDTFLANGFNLENNDDVNIDTLFLRSSLVQSALRDFINIISPYETQKDLKIADGDSTGVILIKANAYEEATSRLLQLSKRTAEDNYNMGLAYEASGQMILAKDYFEIAVKENPGNDLFKNALSRVKKYN